MTMTSKQLGLVLAQLAKIYLVEGDSILFVADESFSHAPIDTVFAGFEHDIVVIPEVKAPGEDYPLDENLLAGKTVAWLITSISVSHSPATGKMLEKGMFLISNPGMTPDWLETLTPENSAACAKSADAIIEAIGGDVGGEVVITSPAGTNLHLQVPSGNWQKEAGERDGIGTNGPFGEVFTAPYSADGTIVLKPGDFLTNPINRVEEKITLVIRGNHVEEISGGKQADQLWDMLNNADDARAFSLGELAIQINPGATPEMACKSVIAEKISGGVHVAIGSNSVCLSKDCPDIPLFKYGRYSAGVHVDVIQFGTSVTINGVQVVKDGQLLF